jgi:hypothetical protein
MCRTLIIKKMACYSADYLTGKKEYDRAEAWMNNMPVDRLLTDAQTEIHKFIPSTKKEQCDGFSKETLEILKEFTVSGSVVLIYLTSMVGVEMVLGSNGYPLGKFVEAKKINCGGHCGETCKSTATLIFDQGGTISARGLGQIQHLGFIPVVEKIDV